MREGSDAPSPRGFSSLVRSNAFGKGKNLSGSRYTFEAPGVIRVRSDKKDGEPIFGAALHCIPIGQGRSRILFKASFLRIISVLLLAFSAGWHTMNSAFLYGMFYTCVVLSWVSSARVHSVTTVRSCFSVDPAVCIDRLPYHSCASSKP